MQHDVQQEQQQQQTPLLTLRELGWQRPEPPLGLGNPTAAEWRWLPIGPRISLLWDSTMGTDDSIATVCASASAADEPCFALPQSRTSCIDIA